MYCRKCTAEERWKLFTYIKLVCTYLPFSFQLEISNWHFYVNRMSVCLFLCQYWTVHRGPYRASHFTLWVVQNKTLCNKLVGCEIQGSGWGAMQYKMQSAQHALLQVFTCLLNSRPDPSRGQKLSHCFYGVCETNTFLFLNGVLFHNKKDAAVRAALSE